MRLLAATLIALAATPAAVPSAFAAPPDPGPANVLMDGPYATNGSYDTVCTSDNVAVQTLGIQAEQCLAMPQPAQVAYTDSIYCKALVTEGFDSNGNTFWRYEVSGYMSTNDSRATYGSVTCRLQPSGWSVSNSGPLPGTITVAGVYETTQKQTSIQACGWIGYTYGNQSRIRYVGNC